MKDVTVVIPARAGSKGIKHKNLRHVNEKSLIQRSVEAVLDAGVNTVYVYSDSEEILKEGERYGAIGIERPAAVSGDRVTTEATVERFIRDLRISGAVMVVQCTTPFLKSHYIKKAIEKWRTNGYDSIVSVAINHRFIGNCSQGNYFDPQWPDRKLRQQLNETTCCWLETGAFYLAKKGLWVMGKRIGQKCGVVVHHIWEALEIDNEIDLEIANAIAPIIEEI